MYRKRRRHRHNMLPKGIGNSRLHLDWKRIAFQAVGDRVAACGVFNLTFPMRVSKTALNVKAENSRTVPANFFKATEYLRWLILNFIHFGSHPPKWWMKCSQLIKLCKQKSKGSAEQFRGLINCTQKTWKKANKINRNKIAKYFC